ncbi:hypothetical protein AAG570_009586 [Ranatra chinensis]|uniref:Uncharacterized protein n=1 Tax=Ranatra chinensis TaxID=642074 RepID=A0ABD0YPR4_9HEMI
MAPKRRNMFHKNKKQETTEKEASGGTIVRPQPEYQCSAARCRYYVYLLFVRVTDSTSPGQLRSSRGPVERGGGRAQTTNWRPRQTYYGTTDYTQTCNRHHSLRPDPEVLGGKGPPHT